MKPIISRGAAVVAAVLMGGAATWARADSLTDVAVGGYVQEYNYYGYNDVVPLSSFGSVSVHGASLTIAAAPGGAIVAETRSAANAFVAEGTYSYYAEVDDPADIVVPLRLYFNMAVSSDAGVGVTYAAATVVFANTFTQLIARNGQAYSDLGSGSYLIDYQTTNSSFEISLGASSQNGGFAYVDPMLEVDPTWAADNPGLASQVSLSFSSGVDNALGTLAVPEPSSWSLMIVGAALMGAALRITRRRTLATAQA